MLDGNTDASGARVDGPAQSMLIFYYKTPRFDVALNVNNVMDRQYISTAFNAITVLPGDPRKLTLTVTTKF